MTFSKPSLTQTENSLSFLQECKGMLHASKRNMENKVFGETGMYTSNYTELEAMIKWYKSLIDQSLRNM